MPRIRRCSCGAMEVWGVASIDNLDRLHTPDWCDPYPTRVPARPAAPSPEYMREGSFAPRRDPAPGRPPLPPPREIREGHVPPRLLTPADRPGARRPRWRWDIAIAALLLAVFLVGGLCGGQP